MIPATTRIKQIEHILEKGSGDQNEDCLVIEKNLFGVFDGASSIDARVFENGITGGKIAATAARDEFAKNHFPLENLGLRANNAIRSRMAAENLDLNRRAELWSTSAAVVRVKEHSIEWFQTGDAQIILVHTDDTFTVLAERDDHDFDTLSLLKKENFKITPAFKSQLKRVRAGMNKTYGVLNGDAQAMEFAMKGDADISGVKTVLLFTDGLCLPHTTPAPRKDFTRFMRIYWEMGLKGLKHHVRSLEADDPDIRVYPRFKRHDDIAAIAIHL